MFKRVLIAIDLKQNPDDLISCISNLKLKSIEKVLLLNVIDDRINPSFDKDVIAAKLEEYGLKLGLPGDKIETQISTGLPFDEIICQANRWEASVIAIGPGHGPTWASSWIGSTALRILEYSPIPIMTCNSGKNCSKEQSLSLMNAMDFSNHAINAYEKLLELLSGEPNSFKKLTLVHIHDDKNLELLLKVANAEQIEPLIEIEKKRLEKMKEEALRAGIESVNISMKKGIPTESILDLIEEEHTSLVVLGAQGQGASEKYRVGKNAYRIAQEAKCCVLIVPLTRKKLCI
ncbi:universal stress protein [Dethiosulfovibrio salsuginis]|uniref:Nucleotide-binding universal stress protein, UspA family n=1 Tax=Dethiosulfovibrio salsuginis TaxID=561720 RepID=A0A1X7L5D7_9BACT|nr:universal stress protein [Dethiosulfovibrio salsuginis]SMG48817.1 Nucleotide-binding universal stress protein, UspA family [Dethiosulfovibrio salsuginis]